MGRGPFWTQEELDLLRDNPGLPEKVLADKLGRSVQAVRNMRMRTNPGRSPGVPELLALPPGTYVQIVGAVLLDYPEVMECWMHAHGYVSFEIKSADSLGWVTLTCVKEK